MVVTGDGKRYMTDLSNRIMMTTILLIRHGQTEWNANGRWQGHADIPLNDIGIIQAEALARRLAKWPIQALYTSDLKRAAKTAEILSTALNLPLVIDSLWRERHVGAFEGLTGLEARQKFPDVWLDIERNGLVEPPAGETTQALHERMARAYEQTISRHTGEMVAVVSHGGTIHALTAHVLGIPWHLESRLSFRGNTGLSIIEVGHRGPRLVLANDTSHLEDGYQTVSAIKL